MEDQNTTRREEEKDKFTHVSAGDDPKDGLHEQSLSVDEFGLRILTRTVSSSSKDRLDRRGLKISEESERT